MKYLIFLASLNLILFSCNNKEVYSTELNCGNEQWDMKNPLKAQFMIDDTTKLYDIGISLTHTDEYPFQNIYLRIVDDFTGKSIVDTININLSNEYGKWIGKGTNEKKIQTLLRKSFKFNKNGKYNIKIEQFTRNSILKDIRKIEFSVLESEK